MAYSTQRTLAQLKKECEDHGLQVVQSGNRESKTDYILALRDYYLAIEYPEGTPNALEWMMSIESPMLCIQGKNFKKEELDTMFESKYFIAEEKIDGFRYMNLINYDGPGSYAAYSRNISVKDFLPVDYGKNLLLDDVDFSQYPHRVVIDSELVSTRADISTMLNGKGVVTETQLQAVTAVMGMNHDDSIQIQKNYDHPFKVMAFDILEYDGVSLMDKPYLERRKVLVQVVKDLQAIGFRIALPPATAKNKKAFAKMIIAQGGEGVILKDVRCTYKASTNRSKETFIKIKRGFWSDGVDDTIDAFITGYEEADEDKSWAGLVGALVFSTNVQCRDGHTEVREIGKISNIDMETREECTEIGPDGKPRLKQDWYGRIAEIQGQCFSARAKRLRHCILVRWRDDKNIEGCSLTEEWIDNNIL